jgi:hypothetical protein
MFWLISQIRRHNATMFFCLLPTFSFFVPSPLPPSFEIIIFFYISTSPLSSCCKQKRNLETTKPSCLVLLVWMFFVLFGLNIYFRQKQTNFLSTCVAHNLFHLELSSSVCQGQHSSCYMWSKDVVCHATCGLKMSLFMLHVFQRCKLLCCIWSKMSFVMLHVV